MGVQADTLKSLPSSVFVLRNNDLGDVLVATPLIEGIKKSFPSAKVCIGVGNWAKPLVENNPHIDEIIPCNAPWHNKQNCRYPANSIRTFLEGIIYCIFSREARFISKQKYSHGIDMLGSRQGSWLLRRSGVTNRFGVKGYAGGENWCQKFINFDINRNVAVSGLEFLRLLGSNKQIEPRPKVYLTAYEQAEARKIWTSLNGNSRKIIIAPGGGFPEKCWGNQNFTELTKLLQNNLGNSISIIGSAEDRNSIKIKNCKRVLNLCGKLNLRQSAAMVSNSELVITNSSLAMHLAGAFRVPSITVLGDWYDSASLHHQQWGYDEGVVCGREEKEGIYNSCKPQNVYQIFQRFQ